MEKKKQIVYAVGIDLLIPYLVKQFLHFTKTPPTLIHPNVFQIMMGCNVLNLLYQMDISLVDICFIYNTCSLGFGVAYLCHPIALGCNL